MADGEEKGYKVVFQSSVPSKGYFIPLTIYDQPPDDSRVVREERAYFLD